MDRMARDDAELIRRWRDGDAGAFDALVRRWQQPAARFLARLVGPSGPVADLCQELFLRIYLWRDRYREEGTFSTWLYRIALNLARDHARKVARQPMPLPEEVVVHVPNERPSWERQELQEIIDDALAELPAPLREVLVLRHYEEMNFEDMGRLLGVPASTLKSRFTVALGRVHQRLLESGWTSE
jgi:RNA polymerase sigma-70 factor, ECF subfamily